MVAQLSPEFTARLVDRWQELEDQVTGGSIELPKTYGEALRLAADQAERIKAMRKDVDVPEQVWPMIAAIGPPRGQAWIVERRVLHERRQSWPCGHPRETLR